MRTDLVAGELTLLQGAAYDEHWRLKVANGDGTLVDISTRLRSGSVRQPNPDAAIGTAEVTLQREIANDVSASLSPLLASSLNLLDDGVTHSPLIQIGRVVTLELAITAAGGARPADGSASWHEIVGGFVKQPSWPKLRSGDITVEIHDRGYKLMRTHIEAPETYAALTTTEATIQAILDDVMGSGVYPVTVDDLAAGGTTGSALAVAYEPAQVPVWTAIQALAQSIGWVLWYRYNASGVAVLTLTEPRRTKTLKDYTFTTAQFTDVDRLTIIEEDIRNVVKVSYINASDANATVEAEDSTSIADFGAIRRYMHIVEGVDSPIRSSTAATTLINAALTDTKDPDADQSINTVGAWFIGEPGVDLYEFAVNTTMYDSAQTLAPYAVSLSFAVGTMASATILARGKPSAGSGTWRARHRSETDTTADAARRGLHDFREISRSTTEIKYGWTIGPDLKFSFIHDFLEAQPYTADQWPTAARVPDTIETSSSVEYTVTIPDSGYVKYFQVEGRTEDGSFGEMERVLIFPTSTEADFVAFLEATVNQTDGSVVIDGWTTDRAKSVAYAYNVGTDPTAPTIAMAEAQGTGATGGGLATGFSSDFAISLAASTLAYGEKIKVLVVAYLNADGTGADTTNTDHGLPAGAQAERFKVTASGQLADGIVVAGKLTEDSQGFISDISFSSTDWDTTAWSSGTITMASGTAYSIASGNTGNLADDGLRYVYLDASVSSTVLQVTTTAASSTGDGVVLMAVTKRAAAGASSGQRCFYIPAVGSLGLNGDNIGANSITASNITAGTITAAEIEAGTITAAEITVGSLSVISSDMGTLDAGRITMGLATSPTAGSGVWIGDVASDGVYRLRVGDPAGDQIYWDGTSFTYPGAITNVGADHGALSGLADDDHAQYVHVSTARTISALHTFSNASGIKTNNIVERTAAAGVTIDGLVIKDAAVITGAWTGTVITEAYGGTGNSAWPKYSIPYALDVDTLAPLGAGTVGQVLTAGTGGLPAWATAAGTVSEVTVGTGLDVATGTTTPAVTLSFDELDNLTAPTTTSDFLFLDTAIHRTHPAAAIPLSIFAQTLGTVTAGVWSGTALVAGKVPAHDDLTGFVLARHFLQSAITETGTVATGTWNGTAIGSNYGGTGLANAAITTGDLLMSNDGTSWSGLGIGSVGQVLTMVAGVPDWATITADITAVATTARGLSVTNGTGPVPDVSLDLADLLPAVPTSPELLVFEAAGGPRKQAFTTVPLSIFSNDAGWTANTGDITGVTAGTNLNGGGASGAITVNLDSTITLTDVVVTSDMRAKTVVADITPAHALAVVAELDVFQYAIDADDRVRAGVSAQQIQGLAPELVFEDADGMLGVDYARGGFAYAAAAIKSLLARVESLEGSR